MKKKADVRSDIEKFKEINGNWYSALPIICDDHIFNSVQLKRNFYYNLYVINEFTVVTERLIKFLNFKQNKYSGNIEALFYDVYTAKNLSIDLIALGLESYENIYTLNCYLKLSPMG